MNKTQKTTVSVLVLLFVGLVVVILLMIRFFFLSTSFVYRPGTKVEIRELASNESVGPNDLVVTIAGNGEVFFRGEHVSPVDEFKQLRLEFQKAARETKDPRLIIQADMNVPLGRVTDIMALATEVGLDNQAIATRPKEETE